MSECKIKIKHSKISTIIRNETKQLSFLDLKCLSNTNSLHTILLIILFISSGHIPTVFVVSEGTLLEHSTCQAVNWSVHIVNFPKWVPCCGCKQGFWDERKWSKSVKLELEVNTNCDTNIKNCKILCLAPGTTLTEPVFRIKIEASVCVFPNLF